MNGMARALGVICSEGEQSWGNLIIPSSVKSITCVFTRLRRDHHGGCQPLSLDGVFTHTYVEVQAPGLGAHCQSLSSDGRV